jgi:dTMP kinase
MGSIYYSIDFVQSAQRYYGGIDTVIFVRYLMGLTLLPLTLAKVAYWIITAFLPVTDYMFFLDLTPEESLKRISGEEDQEAMFKDLEGLMKSHGKALKLAGDWHVIKVDRDVSEVQGEIENILDELDSQQN